MFALANTYAHFELATGLMNFAFCNYLTADNEFIIVGGIDGFCAHTLKDVERNRDLRRRQAIFQWMCVQQYKESLSRAIIEVLNGEQLTSEFMDFVQFAQDALTAGELRCLRISLELRI
jgi:hypothetical protein